MPFSYPPTIHVRRHGPAGYLDYRSYKPWLRDEFSFRCVYCLMRETYYPNEQDSFAVEHVQPQHSAPDRVTDYENLLYACNRCNSWKQIAVLLDPTREPLGEHVRIDQDGIIVPLTENGWRLIRILHLDGEDATRWRRKLLELLRRALAKSPVNMAVLQQWFGFPEELPDLAALRPAGGNTRPTGIISCYHEQRRRGVLPVVSDVQLPVPMPPSTQEGNPT